MRNPLILCGEQFGLQTFRDRAFEIGGFPPPLLLHRPHSMRATKQGRPPKDGEALCPAGNFSGVAQARRIMDIPWMSGRELSQSIPPAYTEWLGQQAALALGWNLLPQARTGSARSADGATTESEIEPALFRGDSAEESAAGVGAVPTELEVKPLPTQEDSVLESAVGVKSATAESEIESAPTRKDGRAGTRSWCRWYCRTGAERGLLLVPVVPPPNTIPNLRPSRQQRPRQLMAVISGIFMSPPPGTRVPALRDLPLSGLILEPCSGEGAIASILKLAGLKTIANDLNPIIEADFHFDATDDWTGFPQVDWVVTNPPFSAAFEILKKAYAQARVGVAFFLRQTFTLANTGSRSVAGEKSPSSPNRSSPL